MTSVIIQNYTSECPLDDTGVLPKKETGRTVRIQNKTPDGDILTDDLRKSIRGEIIFYQ